MKTILLFLVLLYGVHCADKIHPKEPGSAGEPKAELMVQRLTLPVDWVGGLYWNERDQMLGYTDVSTATYHMWYKQTGKTDQAYIMELAGKHYKFGVPIKNQHETYLAAVDGEIRIVTKPSDTYHASEEPVLKLNDTHMKITNGHCDAKGRLFFGTHATCTSLAKLYKVEDGKAHVMETAGTCIDDLAWSVNFAELFVITNGNTIWKYEYDLDKGTLGDHPKVAFSIIDHPMLGTKMTGIETDDNGTLWVSASPEGVLMNIDPKTTEVLQFVKLPVDNPTCLTFGGYKGKNLYVGTKKSSPVGRKGEGSVYVVSGFSARGTHDQDADWPL